MYLKQAKKIVEKDLEVINTTKVLINKLYKVKDKKIFKKIKEINENVKIINNIKINKFI